MHACRGHQLNSSRLSQQPNSRDKPTRGRRRGQEPARRTSPLWSFARGDTALQPRQTRSARAGRLHPDVCAEQAASAADPAAYSDYRSTEGPRDSAAPGPAERTAEPTPRAAVPLLAQSPGRGSPGSGRAPRARPGGRRTAAPDTPAVKAGAPSRAPTPPPAGAPSSPRSPGHSESPARRSPRTPEQGPPPRTRARPAPPQTRSGLARPAQGAARSQTRPPLTARRGPEDGAPRRGAVVAGRQRGAVGQGEALAGARDVATRGLALAAAARHGSGCRPPALPAASAARHAPSAARRHGKRSAGWGEGRGLVE